MAQTPAIDWQRAERTGISLVRPGPKTSRAEMEQLVVELHRAADRAPELVAQVTELPLANSAPVYVVDRPGIIRLNAATAAELFNKLGLAVDDPKLTERISGGAAGAAVGTVLAVLAGRILGQFDPYGANQKLALVAPNVLMIERSLKAVPADFRLWVCLHEQTHQAQFAVASWLPGYVIGLVGQLVDGDGQGSFLTELPKRIQGLKSGDSGSPVLGAARHGAPAAAEVIDTVTAVMSVLEGHADVVMDSVGPKVIPSWAKIRRDFTARRRRGGFAAVIGKLFGLDAKLAQYANGAAFCKSVIDSVGMGGLNRVFRSAADMPTLAELHDPAAWLARHDFPAKPRRALSDG
jgi:coenzyme F420 biosynthesis associated uncharacterized protein